MATKSVELARLQMNQGVIARAAPDEPLFILRAHDRYAPYAIERWAELVEKVTANIVSGTEGVDETRAKIKEARALAHDMRAWQERNGSKIPD